MRQAMENLLLHPWNLQYKEYVQQAFKPNMPLVHFCCFTKEYFDLLKPCPSFICRCCFGCPDCKLLSRHYQFATWQTDICSTSCYSEIAFNKSIFTSFSKALIVHKVNTSIYHFFWHCMLAGTVGQNANTSLLCVSMSKYKVNHFKTINGIVDWEISKRSRLNHVVINISPKLECYIQ